MPVCGHAIDIRHRALGLRPQQRFVASPTSATGHAARFVQPLLQRLFTRGLRPAGHQHVEAEHARRDGDERRNDDEQ